MFKYTGMDTDVNQLGKRMHYLVVALWLLGACLGVTSLTTTDLPSLAGPCVTSCAGMPEGNFQSCYHCHVFNYCTNDVLHVVECPEGLVWDDSVKRCEFTSTTCPGDLSFSLGVPTNGDGLLSYTEIEADWIWQLTTSHFTAPSEGLYMFSLAMEGIGAGARSMDMYGEGTRHITTGRNNDDPSTGSTDVVLSCSANTRFWTEGQSLKVLRTTWAGFSVSRTMVNDSAFTAYIDQGNLAQGTAPFAPGDVESITDWTLDNNAFIVPHTGLYVVGFSVDGQTGDDPTPLLPNRVNLLADDAILLSSVPRADSIGGASHSRVGLASLTGGQRLSLETTSSQLYYPSLFAFHYDPLYGSPVAWTAHMQEDFPGAGSPVIYDQVPVNVGDAFNELTGRVAIHIAGRYYVSFSMGTFGNNNFCQLSLHVNSFSRAILDRRDLFLGRDTLTRSVILNLHRLDHIQVYVDYCDSILNIPDQVTSFSGFLIHTEA